MTVIPDSSDLSSLSDLVGPLKPPTVQQIADARHYIAAHARNASDLADLLAAVGIGGRP